MTRSKPLAAILFAAAAMLFSAGCRTTVVEPVRQVDKPVPVPQHYDDHHDDHRPPPPPPRQDGDRR